MKLEWAVGFSAPGVLLDSFQSGFRLGFGTETDLVTLTDDLYQELDKENMTLLDRSMAFDTISHSILLNCFLTLGLGEHHSSPIGGGCQKALGDSCFAPDLTIALCYTWSSP